VPETVVLAVAAAMWVYRDFQEANSLFLGLLHHLDSHRLY